MNTTTLIAAAAAAAVTILIIIQPLSGSYGRPVEQGRPLYFHAVVSTSFSFFSSPNLSGRRLDICHTSTHDVALVRI